MPTGMNGVIWQAPQFNSGQAGNPAPGFGQFYDPSLGQIAATGQQQQKLQQGQQDFTGQQNALQRQQQQWSQLQAQGSQAALQSGAEQFTGQQAAAQRALESQLAGQQDVTTQRGQTLQAQGTERGQTLQFQAAQLPYQWSREVFGQIMPLISGLSGQLGGGGIGAAGGGGPGSAFGGTAGNLAGFMRQLGGPITSMPDLPSSTIYSPQQIQSQINAGQAKNQQSAATQQAANQANMAGRGFGAGSPLLQAMNNQVAASTIGANSDMDMQTRMAAAQANAQQGLGVGQLAAQNFASLNQANQGRQTLAGNLAMGQNQSLLSLIQSLTGMARV